MTFVMFLAALLVFNLWLPEYIASYANRRAELDTSDFKRKYKNTGYLRYSFFGLTLLTALFIDLTGKAHSFMDFVCVGFLGAHAIISCWCVYMALGKRGIKPDVEQSFKQDP